MENSAHQGQSGLSFPKKEGYVAGGAFLAAGRASSPATALPFPPLPPAPVRETRCGTQASSSAGVRAWYQGPRARQSSSAGAASSVDALRFSVARHHRKSSFVPVPVPILGSAQVALAVSALSPSRRFSPRHGVCCHACSGRLLSSIM